MIFLVDTSTLASLKGGVSGRGLSDLRRNPHCALALRCALRVRIDIRNGCKLDRNLSHQTEIVEKKAADQEAKADLKHR